MKFVSFPPLSRSRRPQNRRREPANFVSHFNRLRAFKRSLRKYSCFDFSEIMPLFAHPASSRGTLRPIVTKREAGCDGRFGLSKTKASRSGRRRRVVLIPRRWDQAGGSHSAGDGG